MAEGKDSCVKDLEQEITCAICHEHYTEPKVLSCCHYYCKQCIHRLALRTGLDKPLSCPECRKDTTLPQGGVDNLQAAFFINRMKEVHSKLGRATGKVEVKCEICSEDKSEAFCRQCAQFICAECVKSHKRMKKSFPGHKVVALEELKEGGAKEIVVQEPTLQMCKLHDEVLKIFCFDCGCLICRDCTIRDHRDHNHEFIKKAAPKTKKKLTQHLNLLRNIKTNLLCAVKEIQTTKSEVEVQGHSVVGHIESSFDKLYQVIKHHKQQLLAEATKKTTCKLERLSGQEKSLSTASVVIQSVIEYAEQCIEHSADGEIMCMHTELQSRIDREIEEQKKEGKNIEPVEKVDMAVEVGFVEELKRLCRTKAKISQVSIDPSKCTVTAEGITNAEINKLSKSKLMVKVRLANGMPTRQKCDIECHLKSLAEGSTTKCKVDRIEGGEYCVQYTPTVRGRHELVVSVNGVEVANSFFPVFVSIHPKQLGKPVRVTTGLPSLSGIYGLPSPSGITINSEGEIIVSELFRGVMALDKRGNRLRSIKRLDHNFSRPAGVAVDKVDNIYFIDEDSNIIYKSDKQMKKVLKKATKAAGGHRCVTVVGDEVMVCERDSPGTIDVYSKELEYVRDITVKGRVFGDFHGISSDEHGNLYVSDLKNSCILVISNGGEILRSFGCDRSGVKKFYRPEGVCVAGQYVYVADGDNANVSVFTTGGEYVTSIGSEGNFRGPWGLCVDKDGFLYVCGRHEVSNVLVPMLTVFVPRYCCIIAY